MGIELGEGVGAAGTMRTCMHACSQTRMITRMLTHTKAVSLAQLIVFHAYAFTRTHVRAAWSVWLIYRRWVGDRWHLVKAWPRVME